MKGFHSNEASSVIGQGLASGKMRSFPFLGVCREYLGRRGEKKHRLFPGPQADPATGADGVWKPANPLAFAKHYTVFAYRRTHGFHWAAR